MIDNPQRTTTVPRVVCTVTCTALEKAGRLFLEVGDTQAVLLAGLCFIQMNESGSCHSNNA